MFLAIDFLPTPTKNIYHFSSHQLIKLIGAVNINQKIPKSKLKIALLTDTHAGIGKNRSEFLELQGKFYSKIFFPELERRGIKQIVHLGDYFDNRQQLHMGMLVANTKDFITPMVEKGLKLDIIVGNHDCFFKNTNTPNSPEVLLSEVPGVRVFKDPYFNSEIGVGYVPWICDENRERTMSWLKETSADVLFGHFEFLGFERFPGNLSDKGLDRADFHNFDLVLSGHFHHQSIVGNIHYLGSIHQATWSDFGDIRGFHIYDTETREREFIENPYEIFAKFEYDDVDLTLDQVIAADYSSCKGAYCKLVVVNKKDPNLFETVLEKMYAAGALRVTPVEDFLDITDGNDVIDLSKDTLTIANEFIDATAMDEEVKDPVKRLFREIYIGASQLGNIS